jgi:hypothetical protein
MNIQVFHAYNNLVDDGLVKPLTCPDCEHPLITRATEDGDPLLACVWCDTITQPGLGLYSQVLAVVKEHNVGPL